MDGDGAMLASDGAEDGAEEAGAEEAEDPPQAVRPSRAEAAIPATANVVRLMVCISVSPLLCRWLPAANFAAVAFPDCWAPTLGWCLNGYSAARRKRMGEELKLFFSPLKSPKTAGNHENPGPKTGVLFVCARGDLNPHARRHRNLNPACLPISPLARGAVVVRERTPAADARLHCTYCRRERPPGRGGKPETRSQASSFRSRRSLATCPVARTLYCASATLPSGSTTMVERMRPW